MADWRRLSRADLDREYSPSSVAPGFRDTVREYRRRSDAALRALPHRDVGYGDHPAERLHAFPARAPGAPLACYVHGGHWQELGRDDSCFLAEPLVAAGWAFAALDYGLAPARTLTAMVASVGRGLVWLVEHAAELAAAPERVVAAGSSAGAHLIAAALAAGWTAPDLAGVVLVSGAYDLEPLRHSYVDEAVGITAAEAVDLSPIRHLPLHARQVVLARGARETAEYDRQQREFAAALRRCGQQPAELVVSGRDHFDVVFDLADPTSELGAATSAAGWGGHRRGDRPAPSAG